MNRRTPPTIDRRKVMAMASPRRAPAPAAPKPAAPSREAWRPLVDWRSSDLARPLALVERTRCEARLPPLGADASVRALNPSLFDRLAAMEAAHVRRLKP